MIARITRILILIQAILIVAFSALAIKLWHIDNFILAALIGLACVIALRITITLNNFYMASRFRSQLPNYLTLNSYQYCRLFLQEFCATMLTSSWNMPFRAFEKHVTARPIGFPVLLIHGYGCNSGYWKSMSKALTKSGITHYAISLEPAFSSIDDYTDAIQRTVEMLCRESGKQKIIIVAHSMGGLAARAYIRDHGCQHVAKVITLGAPHHGTALARHAIGINTEQMHWTPNGKKGVSSEWLRKLDAGESHAVRILFVSIYSHHDNIISPQTSSHLAGAQNIALHGIGHVALALHPKVQAIVIDEVLHMASLASRSEVQAIAE